MDGPVLRAFSFDGDPYGPGLHRGVDVGGIHGSSVRAPAGGTVSFAGTVPGGGRTVTIRTDDGYAVTLLHLGEASVRRGALVAEGEPVGALGTSGEAEHPGAYVHLGVRVASDPQGYVDPLGLLPERSNAVGGAEPTPAPLPGLAEGEPPPAEEGGVAEPEPPPAVAVPVIAEEPASVESPLPPDEAPADPVHEPSLPVFEPGA
ncbi:MAG TPA: M23 family metallopeptidase, partial [Gaiellaceae bacterium]|nr:M23 family metallopeptidase [Gaiellaceae bacterium]